LEEWTYPLNPGNPWLRIFPFFLLFTREFATPHSYLQVGERVDLKMRGLMRGIVRGMMRGVLIIPLMPQSPCTSRLADINVGDGLFLRKTIIFHAPTTLCTFIGLATIKIGARH
ncbi:MAG: hypothetical protein IJS06_03880, partial [Prevotella sp.]|nr:hypothetical protein [Prevotella sp.]